MKLGRFIDGKGNIHWGREQADGAVTLAEGSIETGFSDTGSPLPVTKRLAPVMPAAILAIGLNYRQHAAETGAAIPDSPVLFMKNPAALCHPEDPIALPPCCMRPPQVDSEVELAVVIGQAARNVSAERALDFVLGYTVGNDVSARRWQKTGSGGQWVRGKSFDTFCPLGPVIVTTDDLPDPADLGLTSMLNGDTMQTGRTSDMIFPVPELIARLSEGMTLLPGTVLLTGTPPGVGVARTPPVFLQDGDLLEMTIERIGTLRNPVLAETPGRGRATSEDLWGAVAS